MLWTGNRFGSRAFSRTLSKFMRDFKRRLENLRDRPKLLLRRRNAFCGIRVVMSGEENKKLIRRYYE